MRPGPTLIVQPARCATPVKITTLASGNTFGAVFWTDGRRDAPMLPDQHRLRKHPVEQQLFWSGEWQEIDSISFAGHRENECEWADTPHADAPSGQDYLAALENGIADTEEKLIYLRIRFWWAGNDPIRESGMGLLPPVHIDNLSRLALLLDEDEPQNRLMKAEAFRELGFFNDALALLKATLPDELQKPAGFIASLCHAQDSRVARFPL